MLPVGEYFDDVYAWGGGAERGNLLFAPVHLLLVHQFAFHVEKHQRRLGWLFLPQLHGELTFDCVVCLDEQPAALERGAFLLVALLFRSGIAVVAFSLFSSPPPQLPLLSTCSLFLSST